MKKSFTLLELMIAIVILGVLSALISGNFFTSLKKSKDARRKADLEQIQQALEMYYEDKRAYPTQAADSGFPFGDKFCETPTCSSNEKIYMQKVPNDPVSSYSYQYQSDGTYYRLFSCIENNLDQGPGVKQTGYTGTNCGSCGVCKYGISSSNTSLP
jgi:type II secretion system protein G